LFQIKKGEMIIREGERVREEHLSKLKQLALYRNKRSTWHAVIGAHLLAALFLALLAGGFYKFSPRTLTSTKDLLLISLVLVGNVLIIKAGIVFSRGFAASLGTIPLTSYYYAIPYAIGAMLLIILLEKEVALVFSVMLTFFVGFMLREGLTYPLVCLFSSLVAVLRANEYKRRSSILVTGLYIGGVNVVTIMTLELYSGAIFRVSGLFDALMGFAGGLFAAVVVSASLPVLEWLFNITSDIKLLELSDLNHPLLRELVVRAPGTYHHSIIVGNLAEAASEGIGANSLLARVSSYFHDIGKIKKPEYFVENLMGEESKHEKLSPSMSSLVIASHVKEGIDLARENNLPEKIIDVIPQHHGTGLITFFYDKAKRQEDPSLQEIKEGDYRYPGPKPQTREAAIVLLADSVEAAARTLTDPTPARIKGLVRKIVHNKFADAQLDESDLTLKDLKVIIESFTRTIMGMYHHRIDYPEGKEIPEDVIVIGEEEAGGSRRLEPTVRRPDRHDDDTEEGPPPLKRFGL
jgi:putative nucleotidyltransferase with HDIG domain